MTSRRTRIKFCGITTPDALDEALRAGADALGFVLADSPRRLTPAQARHLSAHLHPFMTPVLVYRHPPAELVREATELIPHAVHQADHADFSASLARTPRAQRLPVFRVNETFEADLADFLGSTPSRDVLVEGQRSGAGEPVDWPRVARAVSRHPALRITLAGGLTPANVAEAVSIVRPFAVDVSSGVESAPGVKDPSLIAAFVEAVRAADAATTATSP